MTDESEQFEKGNKLRLALRIMSGRSKVNNLSVEDFEELGYDTYRFSYYGKPSEEDIKEKAEDILFNSLNK